MAENENTGEVQELGGFDTHLTLVLQSAGVENVAAAIRNIHKSNKQVLRSTESINATFGDVRKAAVSLGRAYVGMQKTGIRAGRIINANFVKLGKTVTGLGNQLTKTAAKLVFPAGGIGGALKATDEYNRSLLSTAASVNRLGIGVGGLEQSLMRVSRETSLTRKETTALFNKYQEGMRFVSLGQFEGMLKRIQSIVGANAKEMDKYQSSIASVSQEYPGLAQGLASLKQASGGVAASEREALQARVRNLYFVGKIKDAEYKRLTSYISGNQQILGSDKARQQELAAQIAATQAFRKQWETVSLTMGKAVLPILEKMTGPLQSFTKWLETSNMSALKLGATLVGAFAAVKIGGGALSALGGMAIGKGGPKLARGGAGIAKSAAGGIGRVSGLALSSIGKIFGKKGGFLGRVGGVATKAGRAVSKTAPIMGGDGQRVFVTNWPRSLGGGVSGLMGPGGGPQLSKGMTSMLKGKGGFLGKLAKILPKGAKVGKGLAAGGAGLALGIGGMIAKKYGKSLEAGGKVKTGAAVGIGGSLASVGAAAATGAMIGSFVPILGTALGGVAGTIVGAVTEWKNLVPGFQKLFGKSDKEKKAEEDAKQDPLKDITIRVKQKVERELNERDSVRKIAVQQKLDIKDITEGDKSITELFQEISAEVAFAEIDLTKARGQLDVEIAKGLNGIEGVNVTLPIDVESGGSAEKLSKDISKVIEDQRSKVESYKAEIDFQMAKYGEIQGGEEQKKKDLKALEKQVEILEKMEGVQNKMAEFPDAKPYRDANAALAKQQARLESINTIIAKQADLASQIGGLYKAQLGRIDAMVESMSITGEIDIELAFRTAGTAAQTLDAEMSAQQELIDILTAKNSMSPKELKAKVAAGVIDKKATKESRSMFKQLQMIGVEGLDQVAVAKQIEESETRLVSLAKERSEIYSKMSGMFKDQLQLTQAQATGAGLLVQLADNYAVGVGASAATRMKEFDLQGDIISILRDRRAVEQRAYMLSVKQGDGIKENLRLLTIVTSTTNEMVSAQVKQASTVKAMRDGWISAISAMNTGAGSFSEIIMNAEQNTAQIQSLRGAIRSSKSGAYARRDAFGYITERVGYQGVERMTQRGDIYGAKGRQFGELSYVTPADISTGTVGRGGVRGVEQILRRAFRGDIAPMLDKVVKSTERVGRGSMEALAAGANEIAKSALHSGEIISEAGQGAGGTRGRGVRGFSMGGGFTSTYIGPPKDDGVWAKALEDAPKDTLPRLIINKEADAIPVFVVNLSEMKNFRGGAGGPTTKDPVSKKDKDAVSKKPVSIEEEMATISSLEKQIETIEKRKEKKEKAGILPLKDMESIAKLEKEIAGRKENIAAAKLKEEEKEVKRKVGVAEGIPSKAGGTAGIAGAAGAVGSPVALSKMEEEEYKLSGHIQTWKEEVENMNNNYEEWGKIIHGNVRTGERSFKELALDVGAVKGAKSEEKVLDKAKTQEKAIREQKEKDYRMAIERSKTGVAGPAMGTWKYRGTNYAGKLEDERDELEAQLSNLTRASFIADPSKIESIQSKIAGKTSEIDKTYKISRVNLEEDKKRANLAAKEATVGSDVIQYARMHSRLKATSYSNIPELIKARGALPEQMHMMGGVISNAGSRQERLVDEIQGSNIISGDDVGFMSSERHEPEIMAATPMMVAPALNTITLALSNLNMGGLKFDNTAELATKFVSAIEGALKKAVVEIAGGYKTDH